MIMSRVTNLNFIAKADLMQLDDLLVFLTQQKKILNALSKALETLQHNVTRNQRYQRIKPTLNFIYSKSSENSETRRRQEALKELDHVSKSLCVFALTDKQILSLANASFDALINGIREFTEAEPGRPELINSAIGGYVHDSLSDLTGDKFRITGETLF